MLLVNSLNLKINDAISLASKIEAGTQFSIVDRLIARMDNLTEEHALENMLSKKNTGLQYQKVRE